MALPPGKKAVGSKWVYKVKTGSEGNVERYKARLVAQGCTQKYGSDYDETFCLFVRQESLRTLVALASQRGLELHHVNVATAFLNAYVGWPCSTDYFARSFSVNVRCPIQVSF